MRTSAPGQSPLLLLDVIDILNKLKIPYAIIGAFAASFHGVIRSSVDADAAIFLKKDKTVTEKLLSELKISFEVTYRHGDSRDPIAFVINIEDRFHNRVDLLGGIKGMRDDAFTRTTHSTFMGSKIRISSIEDFVAMKIFAGGHQDIEDVRGVLRVSSKKLNVSLLKEISAQYGRDVVKKLETLLKESGQLKPNA